jgi:hypothetical protein
MCGLTDVVLGLQVQADNNNNQHLVMTFAVLTFDSLAIPDTALRYGIVIISTLRLVCSCSVSATGPTQ